MLRDVSLDDKYRLEAGTVFLTGVQALVRLPLEQRALDQAAGLDTAGYVTGYPGSPLASYDVQLRLARERLAREGVRFQPGLNEDLAMTAVWGTQQAQARGEGRQQGVFALWYGKGAGLDRSGDALRHGNLAGSSRHGGVLLLLGDDPRAESSSVTHYSEYTMVDFLIPVLHPGTVDELLRYGLYGIAMSRYTGSWIGMKCVHDVVESAASVRVDGARVDIRIPDDFTPPAGGMHLRLPDDPLAQEERLHTHRMQAIAAFARANPLDRCVGKGAASRFGVIATGRAWLDLLHALGDLGIAPDRAHEAGLALYKVGMPWPLEANGVKEFCAGLDLVMVVEEKRSLIESQVKELLFGAPRVPRVIGKTDEEGRPLFRASGTIVSNDIAVALGRRLTAHVAGTDLRARLEALERRMQQRNLPAIALDRKPYFCAGCPHNRSTRVPEGSRGGAGTGCNYMVMWMERGSLGYTQMGADGVNWIGEAPFSNRRHVFQNMGDGTYTHSGLLAVRAAIAAKVNITFKILYNGVVAMTGGQDLSPHFDVLAIARQVLAEGVRSVVVVTDDPSRHRGTAWPPGVALRPREAFEAVQRELAVVEGVTVLIYDQMCATEKRRLRKRGKLAASSSRAFINAEVCEGCGDCGATSNCIAIVPRETPLGRKRAIDQQACNQDFSCVEGFCPSFVTIEGGVLRRPEPTAAVATPPLPDPVPAIPAGQTFNLVISGVGGTGVVTVAAILGMAAHLEGKGVATLDMMGLSQKGGAVTSHLRIFASPEETHGARVPGGTAHVLLACDLLAAAGREPISAVGEGVTRVLVNTRAVMPGDFTRHPDLLFPQEALERKLVLAAGAGQVEFLDATRVVERATGDSIGANMAMVGYAFQRGLIPLSEAAILKAVELNGAAIEMNRAAFRAGREVASAPSRASPSTVEPTATPLALEEILGDAARRLTAYQNAAYARSYLDRVAQVRAAEQSRVPGQDALARAVAVNLARLMAYKDEYEVARLYTDGTFRRELARQFVGPVRLSFHLAPPLLARRDRATGRVGKRRFGGWMEGAFRILASLRGLRGTPFDPFGYQQERRMERRLVADYERCVTSLLPQLAAANHALAVEIATLPSEVRGFGHVKAGAVERMQAREAALLAAFARITSGAAT